MKICLLFQEHCSDKPFIQCSTPTYLNTDLELGRILEHMADGDSTIQKSCEEALLSPAIPGSHQTPPGGTARRLPKPGRREKTLQNSSRHR